jgi:hypothetical protein
MSCSPFDSQADTCQEKPYKGEEISRYNQQSAFAMMVLLKYASKVLK